MTTRTLRIGFVMDPLAGIDIEKDTTFVFLEEAGARGHECLYISPQSLSIRRGVPEARMQPVSVRRTPGDHFTLGEARLAPLEELDVVLLRKDPPFDMEYIYTTYILDRAALAGCRVVNAPQALRDMNEKAYTAWYPDLTPLTLITRSMDDMRAFLAEHGKIVVKPLDGMGGRSIFVVALGDGNANVIFETLTDYGRRFAMAQVFVPEITLGDKRILLIDGEPVPYALARIPSAEDNRGNLVMGATGKGQPLSDRDREICATVGPALRAAGVVFAGIDVIGDFMTEINVTSPTGIRELDKLFGLNIAGQMFDAIEDAL